MKIPRGSKPKVGQNIYVDTSLYIDRGEDDFQGGLCEIDGVEIGTSGGESMWFISVKERPGHSYNYRYLSESQNRLKKEFGERRGFIDPDIPGEGTLNRIRRGIAWASDSARLELSKLGVNTHVFQEEDLHRLLSHKNTLPVFIGICDELDKHIELALREKSS